MLDLFIHGHALTIFDHELQVVGAYCSNSATVLYLLIPLYRFLVAGSSRLI